MPGLFQPATYISEKKCIPIRMHFLFRYKTQNILNMMFDMISYEGKRYELNCPGLKSGAI